MPGTSQQIATPIDRVSRAIWFIETHFTDKIALDEIAAVAGISRFHLSRVFAVATGVSVTQYIRGRRLTEAARRLAAGAPDILAVALDSGYNSHEAFTRAFRDQFGVSPELLRKQSTLSSIQLTEPLKMDETLLRNSRTTDSRVAAKSAEFLRPAACALLTNLEPPRFVDGKPLLIAGLSERCNPESSAGIPAQWQKFAPHIGHIPGQTGFVTYGVLCNPGPGGTIDYMCGVEVSDFSRIPSDFARIEIPAKRYAVFTHRGHISGIRQTWFSIMSHGLNDAGATAAGYPEFERYGDDFNPATGNGAVEIWIPVQPAA